MTDEDQRGATPLEVGEGMFDHENARRMNSVHPHTVNNEHDLYANRTRVEALSRKYESRIISLYVQGSMADPDDEDAIFMAAADYTGEGAIDRSVGGFAVLGPNVTTEVGHYTEVRPQSKGWLRNPFKKKEEPPTQVTQAQVTQR